MDATAIWENDGSEAAHLALESRWDSLIEAYGHFLRGWVSRLCPRRLGLHPDEIEQEARIRLWRALRTEKTITRPASYVYRVAATAAIDAIRRVKARREEPLEDSESPVLPAPHGACGGGVQPEEALDRRLLLDRVREVIATMPERRRRAVGLHLQGFTTTEIADLTGNTEPAARNLVYRALSELRERLRREEQRPLTPCRGASSI